MAQKLYMVLTLSISVICRPVALIAMCCRSQCVQAIARVAGKNHISRLICFLH